MYEELIAEARQPWRPSPWVGTGKPPIIEKLADALEHVLEHALRDLQHWQNNHATEVRRARALKDRTDMPFERVRAYEQWGQDLVELSVLRAEVRELRAAAGRPAGPPNVKFRSGGFC